MQPAMSPAGSVSRPQTIKQAKAAFKSRGQPALSDREKRQLERSIELDRRAWRIKEAEKRKAEVVRKKVEKEREERERLAKVQMGSQRRCDRFGHQSSQMHLGAFLKRNKGLEHSSGRENVGRVVDVQQDDFEEDEVDDETRLGAMVGTTDVRHDLANVRTSSPYPQLESASKPLHCESMKHDFECFLDELESSTQIARELGDDEPSSPNRTPLSRPTSLTYGDFDLSADDVAELERSVKSTKVEQERTLMPPPALPSKLVDAQSRPARRSVPVPKPGPAYHSPLATRMTPASGGFTMFELENYVDDDLQLTQVDPG